MFDANFPHLFSKMENIIKIWQQRNLTLIGKVLRVKSLLISQLVYKLSILQTPHNNYLDKVDNIIQCFLWDNKPPRIALDI